MSQDAGLCPLCGGEKVAGATTFAVDLGFGVVSWCGACQRMCAPYAARNGWKTAWRRNRRPSWTAVLAAFVPGRLTSRQSSSIIVTTDRQESPRRVLRMVVHVPEILRLSTNTLTWGVGEEPEAKTIGF